MSDDLFAGPTVDDITTGRMIESLQREIDLRQRVYPKWVESGRMTQREATEEILCMQAARDFVVAVVRGDNPFEKKTGETP